MSKKMHRVAHGLALLAFVPVLSSQRAASAASVTVTSQVRTDSVQAGAVNKSNSAPGDAAFNDITTATSPSTLTTATASQKSSFGPSGSNFVADVTLGSKVVEQANEANDANPSFELDFNVSQDAAYTFAGATTLSFNGSNDFYTGMNLQLLEGGSTIFGVNQGTLTTDPQTLSYSGTLAPGSYVLKMSLDSGGAGGNIDGSLKGTLTIANGTHGTCPTVPLPPAAATAASLLAGLGVVKFLSDRTKTTRAEGQQ
jgi:hypothetical protein